MKQHARAAQVALLGALALAARVAHAQQALVVRRGAAPAAIGGDAEDRARLAQLRGAAPLDGWLLRSASTVAAARDSVAGAGGDTIVVQPWLPTVALVSNSALPFSLNDGALWAGKGTSVSVTGGARFRYQWLRLTLAPTLFIAQNAAFPLPTDPALTPPIPPPRSPFGYPFRIYGQSIDLPLRFGDRAYQRLDPGQSALYAVLGPVETGYTTENEWWGPGIRNALVMSNNAAGVPRWFVRTARPLRTPIGAVEARYSIGSLSTSQYFEDPAQDDRGRSLSTIAVTLTPPVAAGLTVGLARSVFAQLEDGDAVFGHLLDAVSVIGRPNARYWRDPTQKPGRDQVYSLFARYVIPSAGFESYAEVGRTEFPVNFRDLLVAPQHTGGYTVGLQYARPVHGDRLTARVQAELTDVEQSSTFRQRPTGSWYTSRAALQGYTQRGQVLGAAIGPGASSQWLAADVLARGWRAGAFAGRIRWDDDAQYTLDLPFGGFCKHDVSVFGGVRGGRGTRYGTVDGSVTVANRLNTFFQNAGACFDDAAERVDTGNTTLTLTYTPPLRW